MFIQRLIDTLRDGTRELTPEPAVANVQVERPAANANCWADGSRKSRRLRSRRWMARSGASHYNGWTVRTW